MGFGLCIIGSYVFLRPHSCCLLLSTTLLTHCIVNASLYLSCCGRPKLPNANLYVVSWQRLALQNSPIVFLPYWMARMIFELGSPINLNAFALQIKKKKRLVFASLHHYFNIYFYLGEICHTIRRVDILGIN